MEGFEQIGRGEENIAKSEIPMVNVVLSELAVPLDDLTPDKEDFRLIPSVALRGLPVHNQI